MGHVFSFKIHACLRMATAVSLSKNTGVVVAWTAYTDEKIGKDLRERQAVSVIHAWS